MDTEVNPVDPHRVSVETHPNPEELWVGPFRLGARIGVGGMAAVWAAEHGEARVPAAIKVVHPDDTRVAMWSDSLRNEVRALARLDHPSIVPLLDHGEITDEIAARSGGRLFAHTPFFVMWRTNGGTLEEAPPLRDQRSLVSLLVRLLGGLAHAHARGVIHRDVKPSNVLLDRPPGAATDHALLSDFGIAHALRRGPRETGGPIHAGTPAYMAPEQIAGRDRDEGPATDLYSVGCLVHRLVNGVPPFSGVTAQICRAHMLDVPPPLVAAWPMPRAFAEWVATLLAKKPSQRFATAAHASAALLAIDADRNLLAPAPRTVATPVSRTATTDRATRVGAPRIESTSSEEEVLVAPRRPSLWPTPTALSDWRSLPLSPPGPKLVGAGLGLYGLRTVPLAGRDAERDRLWSRLRRARDEARTQITLVRGHAGYGKTRLAEWLAESAHELGVAVTLLATHGASGGPADGLAPMLVEHLRARDLERSALLAHIEAWLRDRGGAGSDHADAEDLAAIVEGSHGRFANPRDRHAALARLLRRIGKTSPLVLVLDDVVFGLDAVAFLESLAGSTVPMLVVATAREEDLVARPDVAERLGRLLRDEHTEEIVLGPLEPDEHARLVRDLLGLEAALADQVADRTSGSPLFAVQLVGDWVQRGIVVPGPRGFVLRAGAEAPIPDDIHEVWRARVAQVLSAARSPDGLTVLELAAVLGARVEINEWRAACAVEGISVPDEVLALAADRGLLRAGETRMDFVHGMLRESLERMAREAGRSMEHHRVCALVVEERGGDPERAAVHHLAARDGEAAIPLFLQAIRRHLDLGDLHAAHHALDRTHAAFTVAGLAADDPRALRATLARAEAFAVQGRLVEANRLIDDIGTEALAPQDAMQLAWMKGIVRQKRGETEEALACFVEGRACAERLDDRAAIARCLYGAAECEKLLGRLESARRHYESAGELFRVTEQRVAEARVLTGLSDLEGRLGASERALALASESRAILEQLGVRHSVAIVTNGMGDLLRKSSRLEEAETSYRDAIRVLDELGSADVAIVGINLGLVMLARDDLPTADAHLEAVESDLDRAGRTAYARLVRMLRLSCAAARADLSRVDAYLDEGERSLSTMVDPDVAWALERAARELLGIDPFRALRAARLSRAQWSALGDHDALARLDAIIDRATDDGKRPT